jgi:hypothetical protein
MHALLWLAGCNPRETSTEVHFVREGLLVRREAELEVVTKDWEPGARLTVEGVEHIAPQQAECVPLFTVPLGTPVLGGDSPDTSLAFSPDGRMLAIGAHTGDLLVVDAYTGEVISQRQLAETLIRQVDWARDGQVLYAAEQSPDATIHVLSPTTLETLASYRLADDVGSSPLPPATDLYGVYTLPAAYGLVVLPDGDLLVAATHGWGEGEQRRNASKILKLRRQDRALVPVAAWPAQGAADAVLGAMSVGSERVAVALRRSAAGPAPAELPIDGVILLDLQQLAVIGAEHFEPLAPYFPGVFIWDSLAVGPSWLAVGMGDGRLVVRQPEGELTFELGTPVMAGSVPIAASIGFLRSAGERLFAVTSRTAIPYGAAAPELRPPQTHPNENTLWSYLRKEGRWERQFGWRGPPVLTGLAISEDEVVVGAGPREGDDRRDQFGALVFDVEGDGQPTAFCATEGPAFHRLAVASDGRIAVAEVPYRVGDDVHGRYQVTVLR